MKVYDAIVIGGGPAGLSAVVEIKKQGVKDVLLIEREDSLGGILLQCIHNGFGLHRFKEELTGPEYAERYENFVNETDAEVLLNTCAISIDSKDDNKVVTLMSEEQGLIEVEVKAVVLAMGCRERNRGNIAIPGSRPAGVMTAGLAQKFVNKYGYIPGKEVVILGSGDIGLIMARRMTWEGAKVKAVVEVQPYPGGLNRNIVQCLSDFNIPLYLSHTVVNIHGNDKITSVDIAPIDEFRQPDKDKIFNVSCDSLLLSVGLVPENELSLKAGVELDKVTNGPLVDSNLMTNIPGIFACGNVLHVHDLVDYVSEESELCGQSVADYINNVSTSLDNVKIKAGNLVRYILPRTAKQNNDVLISLRCMAPSEGKTLFVKNGDEILYKKKHKKIFPSEMERIKISNVPEGCNELSVSFE